MAALAARSDFTTKSRKDTKSLVPVSCPAPVPFVWFVRFVDSLQNRWAGNVRLGHDVCVGMSGVVGVGARGIHLTN